jgi:hypothetical protein
MHNIRFRKLNVRGGGRHKAKVSLGCQRSDKYRQQDLKIMKVINEEINNLIQEEFLVQALY